MTIYAYALVSIAEEFAITTASLAVVASAYTLMCNGFSWVAGLVANKVGARLTIAIGEIGNGAACLLVGICAHGLGLLVFLYAIAGAFATTMVGTVMPKLISDWFSPRHRGKVNTCYSIGPTSVGALLGIIAPMLLMGYGWRSLYYTVGLFVIACGVFFLLVVRDTPAKMGTHAFGYTEEEAAMLVESLKEASTKTATTKSALKKILTYKFTWIFGIVYMCWIGYIATYNTYFTPGLMTSGINPVTVGLINSTLSVIGICSQIFFTTISDYVLNRKLILGLLCLVHGSLQLGLYFMLRSGVGGTSTGFLFTYMIILGIFNGQGAIINTISCEVFPPSLRAVGPGIVATVCTIGSAGGPLVAGAIIASMGDFTLAYLLFSGPCCIAAALILFIFIPKSGGKHGDPLAIKEAQETLGEEAVAAAMHE
ncbi:MAG: MFS transporter [bacterium]|nr:MFS transporter [bacterium]